MQATVLVKLALDGQHWHEGILTAEPDGMPIVTFRGVRLERIDVAAIRVNSECPLALFRDAIEWGYLVLGVPALVSAEGRASR